MGGAGAARGLRLRLPLRGAGPVGGIRGGLAGGAGVGGGAAAPGLRQGSAGLVVGAAAGRSRACLLALQGGLLVAWAAPASRAHRPGACVFAMCLSPGGWARLAVSGEAPEGVPLSSCVKVGTEGAGRAACEVFIFASAAEAGEWVVEITRAARGAEPVPGLQSRLAAAEEALARREGEHAAALEGALGDARRQAREASAERERAELATADRVRARKEAAQLRLKIESLETSVMAAEGEAASWRRRGARAEEAARVRAARVEERAQELTASTAATASHREAELHRRLDERERRELELEEALAAEREHGRQLERALAQESSKCSAQEEKSRFLGEALRDGRSALEAASARAVRLEVQVGQQRAREAALAERAAESQEQRGALERELAGRSDEALALSKRLEQAFRDGSERDLAFSDVRSSLEQSVVHLESALADVSAEAERLAAALAEKERECVEYAEERLSLLASVEALRASLQVSEAERAREAREGARGRADQQAAAAALHAASAAKSLK